MESVIKLKIVEKQQFTVNWNDLPDEVEFVAVDKDGEVVGYEKLPETETSYWYAEPYDYYVEFKELRCKVLNWRDTLRSRALKTRTVINLEVEKEIEYTVDWSKLPDNAKFVAVDDDGVICWYSAKPKREDHHWDCCGWDVIDHLHENIVNWQETLVARPQPKQVSDIFTDYNDLRSRLTYAYRVPSSLFKHTNDEESDNLFCLNNRSFFENPKHMLKIKWPKYAIGDKLVRKATVSSVYKVEKIIETEGGYCYRLNNEAGVRSEESLSKDFFRVLT